MYRTKEATIPLRRSELISPNGVGALTTNSDGVNMMPGALDIWYEGLQLDDFVITEDRLKRIFSVKEFRLPPDYRKPFGKYNENVNSDAQIPMLRFPNFHFCSHCKVMSKRSDYVNDSKISCDTCANKFARLIQVPIVVVCENGHIDDFPWNEWTHKNVYTQCNGPLKLISTGGSTLSTMKIICTKCDAKNTLQGLTTMESTVLSTGLAGKEKYKCTGRKPWFGNTYPDDQSCECNPQPILKNATNGYYPQVLNAIYIPIKLKEGITEVLEIFEKTAVKKDIEDYIQVFSSEKTIEKLQSHYPELLIFDKEIIEEAIALFEDKEDKILESEQELDLKIDEYDFLSSKERIDNSTKLKVIPEYNDSEELEGLKSLGIAQINLIPKLIETRVLYGFSRLKSPDSLSSNPEKVISEGKKKLFMYPEKNSWLPAYQVFGEGIYIEFKDEVLTAWERAFFNSNRFNQLRERLLNATDSGVEIKEGVSPRFVFLHTLAHLIIKEVVLSSGYSSSSLKERIYCGPNKETTMNGFLIYTASGDSEGTMGGLVRLGSKESLQKIIKKVIEEARWCSSDPVCNEIGKDKGQGRDYLNGAACHNCSYVSEISCEEFNKYLDRGFVASYENEADFKSFFNFVQEQMNL